MKNRKIPLRTCVVSKEKLTSALVELEIPLTVRAEQLSLEQFAVLADKIDD